MRELEDHRAYLADGPRVDAFARAIQQVVRPGSVVVDLGCGTGILGLLACRAGAARVYAIDQGDMIEVARSLAAANGYADRIVPIRGYSLDVSIPEPADVVVADQTGHFGFEAGILEFFDDARRRFLKPGGQLIPRQLRLWLAPVEQQRAWDTVAFWGAQPGGFDMKPIQEMAWNSGHPWRVDEPDLAGPPQLAEALTLGDDNSYFSFAIDLPVGRRATLHGIVGWFSAETADGIWMSNAPGARDRIDRRNTLFLLREPPVVAEGDVVRVAMAVRPYELIVKWTVEHVSGGRVLRRFEQSTFSGMLFSGDDVRRTNPEFVPRLSERGAARRLVLDLADGRTSVRTIERTLLDRHPKLFADAAGAAAFAAGVLSHSSE